MSNRFDDYDVLHEADGWSYIREKKKRNGFVEHYSFIVHKTCSGGGVGNMKSGGSVMHYKTRVCQSCGQTPGDEVMGAYILHRWSEGRLIPLCPGGNCKCCAPV